MCEIVIEDILGQQTIVLIDYFDSVVIDIPIDTQTLLRYVLTSIKDDNNNEKIIQEQFLVSLPEQASSDS